MLCDEPIAIDLDLRASELRRRQFFRGLFTRKRRATGKFLSIKWQAKREKQRGGDADTDSETHIEQHLLQARLARLAFRSPHGQRNLLICLTEASMNLPFECHPFTTSITSLQMVFDDIAIQLRRFTIQVGFQVRARE